MKILNIATIRNSRFLKYSFSVYIYQLSNFVSIFLIAKVLGPVQYGLWSIVNLISVYIPFFNLGLTQTMVRKVPEYLTVNSINEKDKIESQSFFTLLLGIFVGYFISILIFIYKSRENPGNVSLFILIGILFYLFGRSLFTYFHHLLRGRNNFALLNNALLLSGIMNALFTSIFVIMFKNIASALIAPVAGQIIMLLVCYKCLPKLQNFRIPSYSRFKYSLKFFVYNLLAEINKNIDRWLVFLLFDLKTFGFYSFAITMLNGSLLYLNSLYSYFYPKTIQILKKKNIVDDIINKKLLSINIVAVFTSGIVIIICVPFFYFFVKNFYYEYIDSIPIYIILSLGVLLNLFSFNLINIALAYDQLLRLSIAVFLDIILTILLVFVGKIMDLNILFICFVKVLNYLALSLGLIIILRHTGLNYKKIIVSIKSHLLYNTVLILLGYIIILKNNCDYCIYYFAVILLSSYILFYYKNLSKISVY